MVGCFPSLSKGTSEKPNPPLSPQRSRKKPIRDSSWAPGLPLQPRGNTLCVRQAKTSVSHSGKATKPGLVPLLWLKQSIRALARSHTHGRDKVGVRRALLQDSRSSVHLPHSQSLRRPPKTPRAPATALLRGQHHHGCQPGPAPRPDRPQRVVALFPSFQRLDHLCVRIQETKRCLSCRATVHHPDVRTLAFNEKSCIFI